MAPLVWSRHRPWYHSSVAGFPVQHGKRVVASATRAAPVGHARDTLRPEDYCLSAGQHCEALAL